MIDGYAAIYIFMLAALVGYEVISRVPVILHTPLMSGSNFVHGIVVVGAMVALGQASTPAEQIIGFLAVLLGTANAVGGYAVTERMLEMFKSSKAPEEGDPAGEHGKASPARDTASARAVRTSGSSGKRWRMVSYSRMAEESCPSCTYACAMRLAVAITS